MKIVYSGPRDGVIRHLLADISKAKGYGYNPKSDFKGEISKLYGLEWIYTNIVRNLCA